MAPKQSVTARGRRWCWTLFETYFNAVSKIMAVRDDNLEWQLNRVVGVPNDVVFLVYQLEKCPTTGAIHLQGCVEFENPASILELKERDDQFGNKYISYRMARAPTRESQVEYCTKQTKDGKEERLHADDPGFLYKNESKCAVIDAIPPENASGATAENGGGRAAPQGGRGGGRGRGRGGRPPLSPEEQAQKESDQRDLIKAKSAMLDHMLSTYSSLGEMQYALNQAILTERDPVALSCLSATLSKVLNNGRSVQSMIADRKLERARSIFGCKKREFVGVQCLWGLPGTGKTTKANFMYGQYSRYLINFASCGKFIGNYNGEQVLILDEMGGSAKMAETALPTLLLTWCTADPCHLEVKHDPRGMYAAWFMVVFISNLPFNEWFRNWTMPGWDFTIRAALSSRLNGNFIEVVGEDFRLQPNNSKMLPQLPKAQDTVSLHAVDKWSWKRSLTLIDTPKLVEEALKPVQIETMKYYDDDFSDEENTRDAAYVYDPDGVLFGW